jgi:hypothetical protein
METVMAYEIFKDQEADFLAWKERNPNGFILNIPNRLKKNDGIYHPTSPYIRSHLADCEHLKEARGEYTTGKFYKVCSKHFNDVQDYCSESVKYEDGSIIDWSKAECPDCKPTQQATKRNFSVVSTTKLRASVSENDFDSALKRTILSMVFNAESAAAASGKQTTSVTKVKHLFHSRQELETIAVRLFEAQDRLCALTGLALQLNGLEDDRAMLASLDRIDSEGHYQDGNLQVVCQFVNFWKSNTPNDEFRRLLSIVKGMDKGNHQFRDHEVD